jgi:hypothetical protein
MLGTEPLPWGVAKRNPGIRSCKDLKPAEQSTDLRGSTEQRVQTISLRCRGTADRFAGFADTFLQPVVLGFCFATPQASCFRPLRGLFKLQLLLLPLLSLIFDVHCSLHTAQCPLLTAHRSPLTAHRSPPTAHCSLLTAHCSLLTAHCSLLTAHCSLLTAHRSLLTAHCSLLTFRRMLRTAR